MADENSMQSVEANGTTRVLYEQLQSEYNKLLKRYAAAENTIDELRTGATVHLYTEAIESRPNSRLSYEAARYPQTIDFPKPLQAQTNPVTTMSETCTTSTTGGRGFTTKDEGVKTSTPDNNTTQDPTLQARIKSLKEDVDTVEGLLAESSGNEETLNELIVICTQLNKEHAILTHELKKQSRNSSTCPFPRSDTNNFSSKAALEKELQRIGLHIDEILQDILGKLRTKKQKSAKSVKPKKKEKQSLSPDLESLVKQMKDLKDASIQSSEEVLNSSKKEEKKKELHHRSSCEEQSKERRRFSEENRDMVDARYFAASPVNMENNLSGNEKDLLGYRSDDEQLLNKTWPPSRHITESSRGNTSHSFLETTQDYCQDSPKSSQRSLNSVERDYNSLNATDEQLYSNCPLDSRRRINSYEELAIGRSTTDQVKTSAAQRSDPKMSPSNQSRPEKTELVQKTWDLNDSTTSTANGYQRSREFEEDQHSPQGKSSRSPDDDPRHKPRSSDHDYRNHPHDPRHNTQSPDHAPPPRKTNSMSSLADSSRMSTPLFQPRGGNRPSLHAPRHKRRNPSDGFDSGFVGSEASRSSRVTTDHPDGTQSKLNLSNQWDSTLHLDSVSEIDENESSPEQMSTAYELTENTRRTSKENTNDHPLTEDVKFINSTPTPPSSPERNPRTPAGYAGYRGSHNRLSNRGNSSPVDNTDRQSLSYGNKRPWLEHRPSSQHSSGVEGTSRTHMNRRRISRGYSGSGSRDISRDVSPEAEDIHSKERERSSVREAEHNKRKLHSLRNEIDSLQDLVNKLGHPRVTMEMYDELRHQDEQLRRADERRHDRKLDELRQSIELLKRDMKLRDHSERHRRKPDRDSEFYDDFRSELGKITEKLDELTRLRSATGDPLDSTESLSTHVSPQDDDLAKRFSSLVQKVDQLRLRIENDNSHENSRYFCRLCDEASVHHRRNENVNTPDVQPRTSTPFVSHDHRAEGHQPITKLDQRSYLSSTYPGAAPHQSPVIHHIHTYHRGPKLKQQNDSDSSSDDDKYVKRSLHRKRSRHRSRYRRRYDISHNGDSPIGDALDKAREAAWDVQRLSKNILNTISLDLTSLRS